VGTFPAWPTSTDVMLVTYLHLPLKMLGATVQNTLDPDLCTPPPPSLSGNNFTKVMIISSRIHPPRLSHHTFTVASVHNTSVNNIAHYSDRGTRGTTLHEIMSDGEIPKICTYVGKGTKTWYSITKSSLMLRHRIKKTVKIWTY
jgi:hypothetical protein